MKQLWKKTHPALFWLVMVALGVSASSSVAVQTPSKKKASATGSARRGKTAKRTTSRRDRGQKAPTPQRVTEIQQALAKDGSFSGTPNGKWDDATVEAMKKFQSSHGLNASGKLDAKTLQQLGLGSQTAGIAPPTPPVRISSTNVAPDQANGTKQ